MDESSFQSRDENTMWRSFSTRLCVINHDGLVDPVFMLPRDATPGRVARKGLRRVRPPSPQRPAKAIRFRTGMAKGPPSGRIGHGEKGPSPSKDRSLTGPCTDAALCIGPS